MSKYNFELKKQVVEYYLNSKCGYKLTGNHFNPLHHIIVKKGQENSRRKGLKQKSK
jgi:hypothetical protein